MNTFYFVVACFDCMMAMWCGLNDDIGFMFIWLAFAFLTSCGIKPTEGE